MVVDGWYGCGGFHSVVEAGIQLSLDAPSHRQSESAILRS